STGGRPAILPSRIRREDASSFLSAVETGKGRFLRKSRRGGQGPGRPVGRSLAAGNLGQALGFPTLQDRSGQVIERGQHKKSKQGTADHAADDYRRQG